MYDGKQLECRIFLPLVFQDIKSTSTWPVRGAIVAHPYAPLGGSYNDPVVGFTCSELFHTNHVVGTFNFRYDLPSQHPITKLTLDYSGAGSSGGRTSWTSKPELGDYVSFYGFMLQYLHILKLTLTPRTQSVTEPHESADQDAGTNHSNAHTSLGGESDIHLILGGYSYGSLIASHLPILDVILDLFQSEEPSISSITSIAKRIATSSLRLPSPPTDPDLRALTTSISYLLVSPLLPPISQLLTIFTTLSLKVKSRTLPCPDPTDQLSRHRTLALAGNLDNFVSAAKLERWSEKLAHMPDSQFQFRMIDGADHFWRRNERARLLLREWLSESLPNQSS